MVSYETMARHNEIGKIGEDLAAQWFKSKNFLVIDRNYSKKWGEIDIVARETDGNTHFVEVKSVSYETKAALNTSVSHGTFNPEDNVHFHKQQRLKRAIETWLAENTYEGPWQIDIVTIRMVPREKYAQLRCIDNVQFE